MHTASEAILQPHHVEVDPRIRLLDTRIREVLEAIAQVERAFDSEPITDADMVTELKSGRHMLIADRRMRKHMRADARFHVRSCQTVRLDPENGRESEVHEVFVLARGDVVSPPVAE